MALSQPATTPAGQLPVPGPRLKPLRLIGRLLTACVWLLLLAMMLRTSRYPVVLSRYSKEYAFLIGCVAVAAIALASLQRPRIYAVLHGNRFVLFWLLVICPIFGFAAVESAMRAFNLLGSEFYSEIRRYMSVLTPDTQLYFRNPSSYRGMYQGVEITTNSLGLRDRPLEDQPASASRILVLGDSITFGWGVSVENTFPQVLEKELAANGKSARTINSGVPGYNTRQELTFLKLYGDRLHPGSIVLLYVDNDVDAIDPSRVHMGIRPRFRNDPAGVLDYSLSRSRLYFMMRHIIPVLLGSSTTGLREKRASAGWRDSMQCVVELARYCRKANVPLAIFHFRMLPDPVSDALEAELSGLANAEHVAYCDTLPWFQGRNVRKLTNSFIDTHPNAEGHRILADGMSHFLLANGVVPASASSLVSTH